MSVSRSAHSQDPGTAPAAPVARAALPAPGLKERELPLLDPSVLEDLAEGLGGGADIARKFAQDYAGLWDQRQRRLMESVACEDRTAALDTIISLKVTSAMVGGTRLAHLAGKLEATVRHGDPQEGAALAALIGIQGRAMVEELQLRYGGAHA
jgi:hypothetical protein